MFAGEKTIPFADADREGPGLERFLRLAALFEPKRVLGFRKIRLGSAADGGYVMLDDFAEIDLAVSFGIDTNADWDLAVARRGIAVQQFDHTVDRPPVSHCLLHFNSKRVVGLRRGRNDVSINSILVDAGTLRDASVILKCDIEGTEWPVFRDCAPQDLRRFAQIIVEFHDFSRAFEDAWLHTAVSAMSNLRADFDVFHVHGNNWRPMVLAGDDLFPDVLEVSFANRRRYSFAASDELFPTPLDTPNNPERPDLYLGEFRFGPRKSGRGVLARLRRAYHFQKFLRRQSCAA
jgi:hypothetical protein